MKIALLTNGIYPYSIGGIQKHSYYLAKYFAKEKIDVEIYHPGVLNQALFNLEDYFELEELTYLNFKEVPFPGVVQFPGHYIYASFKYSKILYSRLKNDESINYIYAQGFTSWYFLNKSAFQDKIISNLHGLEMFQHTINKKNKFQQFLLKIPANYIIKQSKKQVSLGGKLTSILYKHGARPNTVVEIPNGIDASWIQDVNHLDLAPSDSTLNFVFVGRYERRKGIEEFHEVIKNTIDTLNYQVQFIGPIPKEKQLNHRGVQYTGALHESAQIKDILIASDILVCPSYSEGMPTVILEAMACGCTIIATDVGAIATMVSAENGWLITGDIVLGLKASINSAMQLSKEKLKLKKQKSIAKVKQNFTWEQVIAKTIKQVKNNKI